jgi:CRISPR-associated protein (TIGR03986 family)
MRRQSEDPKDFYYFLNPYNFVRPPKVRNPNVAPLLGRCTPPPHDRYAGITGRITCRLIATTPIFVSDSHDVMEEDIKGKEHRHYRFFRDPEGRIAIPGTSLRGAIRSVFEAATNSCFAHFAANKRLSYHLPPPEALKLVPARVQKVNEEQWQLELMPGTTNVYPGRRPSGPQYAAWIHAYQPLWGNQTAAKVPNSPYAARQRFSLSGWKHKDPCHAVIELIRHPLRRFEFWNVVVLAKSRDQLPNPTKDQRIVEGYLCLTNQNIENKHDERLFFSTQPSQLLDLTPEVRNRYQELIADYQERHADDVRKRQRRKAPTERPDGREPALSRFIVHKSASNLADGDLVYAMLGRDGNRWTVEYIVPVSVPRLGYAHKVGRLLSRDATNSCKDYYYLCPACRIFGWVWNDEDPEAERPRLEKPTAYAGRVRFSSADRKSDAGTFDTTLAILSTPKPTTTRFYLSPQNGKPQDGLDDHMVGYDADGQVLRGRKVYRHHGDRLSEQEYRSVDGKKSDQNRTVHDVQSAGTEFEFTVDFENLAEVELGALLWTLGLEEWHHRIGLGKPLGFGSVRIEIKKVRILDVMTRYGSLSPANAWSDRTDRVPSWIQVFKQGMQGRYGVPFDHLVNVRDLKALLAESPALPVHYPRSTREPHADGKNYEWFVGNKRSGRNAGPRLVLVRADEDNKGLPLINRFGEEQR